MKTSARKTTSMALAALLCLGGIPVCSVGLPETAWAEDDSAQVARQYSTSYPSTDVTFGSSGSNTFWGESVLDTHVFNFTVPRDMDVELDMTFWALSCTHGHFSADLVNDSGEETTLFFFEGATDIQSRKFTQKLKKGSYHLEVIFSQSHKNQMGTFSVSIGEKKPKPSSGFRYAQKSIKVPWSGGFSNSYVNRSGGALTDKTSNPKVATFNANGDVVFKGIGQATITTTQAETDSYIQSSASFVLTIVPDKPAIKTLTAGKKSFKIKWKKQSKKFSSGYEIRYSTKKNMKKAKIKLIKGAGKSSAKIKGLKAGKKYYVQVRVFKKVGGKTYYSSWSSKKAVRIKK